MKRLRLWVLATLGWFFTFYCIDALNPSIDVAPFVYIFAGFAAVISVVFPWLRKLSLTVQLVLCFLAFMGFKAYLGRHTEPEENGPDTEVEIYFRIIVDWRYQSQRQDELSLHRAAIVISQVPIEVGAGRERFYRYQPSHSPFRMLACGLDDARVI